MLNSIDILIGLSLVMLMGSVATMLVTQALLGVARSRGRHLLHGLTGLLQQIHPTLDQETARKIADAVLLHPLIRGSRMRRGTVVKREELVKLMLELADPTATPHDPPIDVAARKALNLLLEANGVVDPAATLKNVRMAALELERRFPEMSAAARHTAALVQEARSELVAKVSASFDHAMDRVTERFTFSSRFFALTSAVIVVLVTQLDAVHVVNRLAMDDQMRDLLVQAAVRVDADRRADGAAPADRAATEETLTPADRERLFALMSEAGLLRVPANVAAWRRGWATVNPGGLLLSVVLLSLGAPFWFKALGNLLRMRSLLAQKDDAERQQRQSETAAATGAGHGAAGTPRAPGGRGDLAGV